MIKLFLTDVDGVMTDGGVYTFADHSGTTAKRFHMRDIHGLNKLNAAGVTVCIVTRSSGEHIQQYLQYAAPFAGCIVSAKDKLAAVMERFVDSGFCSWDEIAYIGDDDVDAELLAAVGVSACPNDAEPMILDVVGNCDDGFVMEAGGGKGCVREFIELILSMNVQDGV